MTNAVSPACMSRDTHMHIGHYDESKNLDSWRRQFITNAPLPYVCFHSVFTGCHNFTFSHASQNRFNVVLFYNPKTDLRMTGGKSNFNNPFITNSLVILESGREMFKVLSQLKNPLENFHP